MRNTILEINKTKFKNNIKSIRDFTKNKAEIMPVVKANAYGTYLNKDVELMNEFNIIAVAMVEEGIELRKLGYKKDIFILNQPYENEIEDIEKYDLIIGCSSEEFIQKIEKNNKQIRIHIELETGMGRTGIELRDLEKILEQIKKNPLIKVEGIYTHLSSADSDMAFTKVQIEKFNKGVEIAKKYFEDIKYIHCDASNGILNCNLGICNLIRPRNNDLWVSFK